MDVPLKNFIRKETKEERFQGKHVSEEISSEKSIIISFENVPPQTKVHRRKNCQVHTRFREAYENDVSVEFQVNSDGTWKTRGHTSLIGVCALIGADCGKVLDMEVMSLLLQRMRLR
ncbi:hypothetical protein TNCV_580211 [Trichonephila clavipes]|nr:hypothetical protein TNCV_580211 [Trichonephila clavipes]